jgi:cytochrome oxidase assembly protein ShyY1
MAVQSGQALAAHYLKLDDSSPGAFETGWQPVTMSAQKHIGYAVQWFALALALVIWFAIANSNLVSYWRNRRQ